MKTIYSILIILLFMFASSCKDKMDISEDQALRFYKLYGSTDEDVGYDVLQTEDGGYIVLGTVTSADNGKQVALFNTDEYGSLLWQLDLGGPEEDIGNDFIINNNNEIVIAATSTQNNSTDIYFIKASLTGDTILTKTFDLTGDQIATSIMQSDATYIITGSSNRTGEQKAMFYRTTENGDSVYYYDDGIPGISYCINELEGNDENAVIIYGGNLSPYKFYGTNHKFGFASQPDEDYGIASNWYVNEMVKDVDNNFILVGTSGNSVNSDIILLKIDPNWNNLWTNVTTIDHHEESPNDDLTEDVGNSLIIDNNGDIVIVGTTSNSDTGDDIYLIKVSPDGEVIYKTTIGGSQDETGEKIALCDDGGYIITGSSTYEGNSMIVLVKVDSEGNLDN